jgi:hypothetical protein
MFFLLFNEKSRIIFLTNKSFSRNLQKKFNQQKTPPLENLSFFAFLINSQPPPENFPLNIIFMD